MKPQKVLLVGGGTAGSVMPLVSIKDELENQSKRKMHFLFVGSKNGIEKKIARQTQIPYIHIPTGKLRRYFDPRNLIDPFIVLAGVVKSLFILKKFKPEIILTAGSFVAVPICWAARMLKIPYIIHQQDIEKGLANRLIAGGAARVTVALEVLEKNFEDANVILTGNPVRKSILEGSREKAIKTFMLRQDMPTILVLGGGTGALNLNKLIDKSLDGLTSFAQILHITGKGKKISHKRKQYFPYEFLTEELKHAYTIADLIITRAGMSTLSELGVLGKAVIIAPLPETHQEKNADYFKDKRAAKVINQDDITPDELVSLVKKLLQNPDEKRKLSENIKKIFPQNADKKYVDIIEAVLDEKNG